MKRRARAAVGGARALGVASLAALSACAPDSDRQRASEQRESRFDDDPDRHVRRARVLLADGAIDAATRAYRRAAAVAPHPAAIYRELLVARLRDRSVEPGARLSEVEPAHRQAVSEAPYQVGRERWDRDDHAGALEIWDARARMFPDEPQLLRNVAVARYELGDYAGAVRDYRSALELAPDSVDIRTDLAWALLRAGEDSEARELCEAVLASHPEARGARAVLAELGEAAAATPGDGR